MAWFRTAAKDADSNEEEARFRRSYARAMRALSSFEFESAQRQFETLYSHYPEHTILLDHLYQLAKLRPDRPDYEQRTRELITEMLRRNDTQGVLRVWREYVRLGEPHHPLPAETHNRVFLAALRAGELQSAERAFDRLRSTGDRLLSEEACRLLLSESERQGLATRVRHYQRLLEYGI